MMNQGKKTQKDAKTWLYTKVVLTSLVMEAFHANVTSDGMFIWQSGIGWIFLHKGTIGSAPPALTGDSKTYSY